MKKRVVMVMYDSLNRRMLSPYGCDWTKTPNFARLADNTAVFDNFFVTSLPCMPARRDLHTGRCSFLHRSWGPIEPFDDSMPRTLKEHGIVSYLVSDHDHYWEDGGCTYHTQYSQWEAIRGQEADPWAPKCDEPYIPDHVPTMREFTHPQWWRNSWCNKERIHKTEEWPQNKVFDIGLDFLEANKNADSWFLQIETFDPHEPFDVPDEYLKMFDDSYSGKYFDWPPYAPVTETKEEIAHIRNRYAALLAMCDKNLGRILDFFDKNDMWKDTMLIVNTDHGFMLGEKDWWAKSVMPCYNELANTPFFIWDPEAEIRGEHRKTLAQAIDIPATILDYFGLPLFENMQGRSLRKAIIDDSKVRDYAIFGFHGSFVNITDGHKLYMKASSSVSNQPLFEYTLMPTHQDKIFDVKELQDTELCALPFAKGCRVMKIPVKSRLANATFCNSFQYGDLLFDLDKDPQQETPLDNPELEAEMTNHLIKRMKECDAPAEQYERLGLNPDKSYQASDILEDRENRLSFDSFGITKEYKWTAEARNIFIGLLSLLNENQINEYFTLIQKEMEGKNTVTRTEMKEIASHFYSKDEGKLFYFLNKLSRIR